MSCSIPSLRKRLAYRRVGLVTMMLGSLLVASAIAPNSSEAASRRIALGNYVWSDPVPQIDLGERITWYWVGPDTGHSVTLASGPVGSIDSDPGQSVPLHSAGFTWSHSFANAGTYRFVCKIHGALPGGTVTVTSNTGNPDAPSPDPVPEVTVDAAAPVVSDLYLSPSSFRLGRESELALTLNERASVQADIWSLRRVGRRLVTGRQVGWQDWQAHIGFNYLPFGLESGNFKPRAGRYRSFIYVRDDNGNEATMRRIDFTIKR